MERVKQSVAEIKSEIAKVIVGQEEVIDGIIITLLIGGHALLEGPPGIAKTLIVRAMARAVSAQFKRVQFTPDLMPLDLTGANIFDFQRQEFLFKPGPVFTDLLLADEINRTPPKTQAALLEAMEERQVTIDGKDHPLARIFTVLATQNPLEYEGTYPLPEAQLDRFFLKLQIGYPDGESEKAVYRRYQSSLVRENDLQRIKPVLNPADLLELRSLIANIQVREDLVDYIYAIIKSTREHPLLNLGASPRAGLILLQAAKAYAGIQGRNYLIPEDIQAISFPVLRHRLHLKPEAQIEGKNSDSVIKNILSGTKIPR